ncbi:MAG TPA: subclass B3 metallo-beta-lactamase [Bryobacteraceae bacterium]|nr:subclass B3 metallo-beta-lactamase [Bryobacteraceae bacterium]
MFLVMLLAVFAAIAPAQDRDDWHQPFPPHRIHGNLYYVGTGGLASFLITTPEGHILINSSFEQDVPLIRTAVEKLGFRFQDIKILLTSHAHADHAAGSLLVKELTAAKVMVMAGDDAMVRDGAANWKPCKVDRVLKDLDEVKLGGTTLVAHLTPGHTKGATTWTFPVNDGNKTYKALVLSSVSINHPQGLVNNRAYPEIAKDYEKAFRVLKSLECDLFLAPHGTQYGMREKYAKREGKENPFVDPDGYKRYIAAMEKGFRERLAAEQK